MRADTLIKCVKCTIRYRWCAALVGLLAPGINPWALGQYVIHRPTPDSCLLPANSYVLWISDATEARVGEVHHPHASAKVNAYLDGGTEAWIRAALDGPCSDTSRTDTIAVSLSRLRCLESSAGVTVRSAVSMELVVLHRSGTSWRVCHSATASTEQQCDNRDEERHERNILAVLADCLGSYRVARDGGTLVDLPYQPEFATMTGDYPILHITSLPKGIFRDLDAFRTARLEPVDDGAITVDRNAKVRLHGDLVSDQDPIWALSDGSHFHLRVDKEFVRLNHNGHQFTTTIRRNAEQQSGRVAVGVGFGAMGAMVSMPRKEEVRMRLDLPTGVLVPVDDPVAVTKAKHIINLSHYADAGASIIVSNWDLDIGLERDAYCELDFPVGSGAELVHIASARGDLWLALDNATPGTHFHLIDLASGGVPVEKEVSPRLAEDMLSRLRPDMRRPAAVEH